MNASTERAFQAYYIRKKREREREGKVVNAAEPFWTTEDLRRAFAAGANWQRGR